MEWKRYKVTAGLSLPVPEEVVVVEAPTPGVALEHYLAGHGMLSYNYAFVEETDAEPSPGYDRYDLKAIAVVGPKMIKACETHEWEPFPGGEIL